VSGDSLSLSISVRNPLVALLLQPLASTHLVDELHPGAVLLTRNIIQAHINWNNDRSQFPPSLSYRVGFFLQYCGPRSIVFSSRWDHLAVRCQVEMCLAWGVPSFPVYFLFRWRLRVETPVSTAGRSYHSLSVSGRN